MMRGVQARCTVCGRARLPFTATTLNLAGEPARIGGIAAKGIGCAVAVVGLSIALGLGLLLQALFALPLLALGVSLPIAIVTIAASLSLFLGGRWLSGIGERKAERAKLDTVRALAAHHGGAITAADAARALDCTPAEADAYLTALAKTGQQNIGVDVDDDGNLFYVFGGDRDADKRWRVLEERARVDVDAEHVAEWQEEAERARLRST
jgi:hypothetical protein